MKIKSLHIQNYKSVRNMEINDIEQALILVGKNNTGKTVILDAIRLLTGVCKPADEDFVQNCNIVIGAVFSVSDEDLQRLNLEGKVSQYKRYDLWLSDFKNKLPSYNDDEIYCEINVNRNGTIRYSDGYNKDNQFVREIFPQIHFIDVERDHTQIESDIALARENVWVNRLRRGCCMFDFARGCNRCFECIGTIEKKSASELNVLEAARLFEYKLYNSNIREFQEIVNRYFAKNGGIGLEILYNVGFDPKASCGIKGQVLHPERGNVHDIERLSTGMKSIYILSLLEAYIDGEDSIPSIILMEDPEIFLHPQLQKVAAEILYRLSKKNQVIFTTHSPNMLFNFTKKQIRQIVTDKEGYSLVRKNADIDSILNDLGYTANDMLNVNFVFIVEGRQDKSRLPLLLNKYYHEVYDKDGKPLRISIITTNSCTNIKTYANLKYINQLYLKDNFLMIRDGDGKEHNELVEKLCKYYNEKDDVDKLPKVTKRNVLVLKYYSFENYFLNPEIMACIGIIPSVEEFYTTFYAKWKEYLYKLPCAGNMFEKTGVRIQSVDDVKNNMEAIKTYMRGHNVFDIFYGPFRNNEQEILTKYIDIAPREDFADILDQIDSFVYFENRKN